MPSMSQALQMAAYIHIKAIMVKRSAGNDTRKAPEQNGVLSGEYVLHVALKGGLFVNGP